jgi:hypothetical protein
MFCTIHVHVYIDTYMMTHCFRCTIKINLSVILCTIHIHVYTYVYIYIYIYIWICILELRDCENYASNNVGMNVRTDMYTYTHINLSVAFCHMFQTMPSQRK